MARIVGEDLEECLRAELELHGLGRLTRRDPVEWMGSAGLEEQAARRLSAAFHLGRRVERARQAERPRLASPAAVHRWIAPELRGLACEVFWVLLLDAQNRLMRACQVSQGTLTSSLVHPREVFAPALLARAAAIICVHNHPSGDPEPSVEDRAVTRRLEEAGVLLGIPLLDHIVVGEGRYVSTSERWGAGGEAPEERVAGR